MAAPRKYPEELRERAIRLTLDARKDPAARACACARIGEQLGIVACHEHGTTLSGFLPASWDHLGCQSWDHPARRVGGSWFASLTRRVMSLDAEVVGDGIQGGQRG